MRHQRIISFMATLALLVAVPALAAIYNSSSDADFIATETAENSEMGFKVEMADLNGDGIDDAIVNEPGYKEGFPSSRFGRVLVYWGGDDDTVDLTIKTAANQNSQGSWHLGYALASGDINGDGIDDLIFSAPFAFSPDSEFYTSNGIVFVVYGRSNWTESEIILDPYNKAGGPLADLQVYNDTADAMIYEESYFFGRALASGDINGDGYDDIIADCGFNEDYGVSRYTRVFVIFGGDYDPEEVLSLNDDHDLLFVSGDFGTSNFADGFAYGLTAGDVTGDSIDDLLIGAPGDFGPDKSKDTPFDGIVYEFNGRADWGTLPAEFDLGADPSLADLRIYGHSDSADGLGYRLAVGDMNGDGTGDIVMSAPQYIYPAKAEKAPEFGDGAVFVLWGSSDFPGEIDLDDSGVPDVSIYGENSDDPAIDRYHLGHNLDTGDINGDCIDDLLIGVEQDNETEVFRMAYAVLGSDSFSANQELNMPDDAEYIANNDDGGDDLWNNVHYGYCTDVALGDFNGDLVADIFVGMDSWRDGPDAYYQGRAWLFNVPTNLPPTANAGEDQEAEAGDDVTLEGSGEDPEGFPITYNWTQASGPEVSLSDSGTTTPGFTPEEAGEYVFRLVVSDCIQDSDPDEVTITVAGEGDDDDDDDDDDEDEKDKEIGFYGSGGCGNM